ncbi:MAG: hypothetical protein U0Y68_20175 [Blastocatellia bacterium]
MAEIAGGRGFALYAGCIALAIGLLHLLLYWFYASQRANLFFGLFACFVFVTFSSQYFLHTGHYGANGIMLLVNVNYLSFYLFLVSLLAFFIRPSHFACPGCSGSGALPQRAFGYRSVQSATTGKYDFSRAGVA